VPVVPADAIARVIAPAHDLLDNACPGRPLRRLGRDLYAISGFELHVLASWLASLNVIPKARTRDAPALPRGAA
jgi:hypothetical protein